MVELSSVVLAAGGTAGHVFPALAIHGALVERGVAAHLFSDERGLAYMGEVDQDQVTVVPSGGLVTGTVRKRAGNLAKLVSGSFLARRALRERSPDLVIGLGGYPSVGPLLAARQLGIPTILHEQNSVMGVANKVTARSASAVALSFDPTEGAVGTCHFTGNPARASIVAIGDAPYPGVEANAPIRALVMGGSQGARSISDRVPAAFGGLAQELRSRLQVVHQARAEDNDRVVAAYAAHGIEATVEQFVDVPAVLPTTHLVVARSGATTVAEVAVARRPAVYLPLLTHRDLQQVKNATAVAGAGGALVMREDETDVDALTAALEPLLSEPERLATMADAARSWSRPNAVDAILELL